MPSNALTAVDPTPFLEAGLTVRSQVPLSNLGSFQIGGPVQTLIECSLPAELGKIRTLAHSRALNVLLIGEGSNLLFSDAGWPGILVRYAGGDLPPVSEEEGQWCFAASMNLQQVVDWTTEHGYAGLEAFNGIPGTLGGAVVGNAGAWGVQMEHVLSEIRGYDSTGQFQHLSVEDCGFRYRDSLLKSNGFWVSEVVLQFQEGDSDFLRSERERILALRAARHPDWKTEPCIGSFFKNIEPSSAAERRQAAGYFLEQAGAKKHKAGGAAVFAGHANILVKKDPDCKAADVAELARNLQDAVKKMHGIDLIREVRYLGEIPGEHPGNAFY